MAGSPSASSARSCCHAVQEPEQTPRLESRLQSGRSWRQRLSVPLAVSGGVLFVLGYLGATMGFDVLPFDRHHVFTQVGGIAVGLLGLSWIGTRR